MNETLAAALAENIAAYAAAPTTFVRKTPPEGAPLGYGRDLSCVEDIDAKASEVDPFTTTAIAQSLLRRFLTRRGSLSSDLNYGLDLRGLLNTGLTLGQLAAIPNELELECTKDERVKSATASVEYTQASKSLRVSVSVEALDVSTSFDFVFVVSSSSVLLEKIT